MKPCIAFAPKPASEYMHLKMIGPLLKAYFDDPELMETFGDPILFLQGGLPEVEFELLKGLGENFKRIRQIVVDTEADLAAAIMREGVAAFLCGGPGRRFSEARAKTRKQGVIWVSLPHVTEELRLCVRHPELIEGGGDYIGFQTQELQDWLFRFLEEKHPEFLSAAKKRAFVSGNLITDNYYYTDRDQILEEYGLPKDKKIVVMSSAPEIDSQRVWGSRRRKLYEKIFFGDAFESKLTRFLGPIQLRPWCPASLVNYETCLKTIRRFCDANDAILVFKKKPETFFSKRRISGGRQDIEETYGDFLFRDQSYFPFTTTDFIALGG